jgi:hypothetical protein
MKSIAAKKKSENIVEYVLYLWQMQDLVRAAGMDLGTVRAFLSSAGGELDLDAEMTWFAELITTMRNHGLVKKGNLPEIDEVLIELNYLHNTLINLLKDTGYAEAWQAAEPEIDAFLNRTDNQQLNPIEAMLTAMYGVLVLKLQGKTPTAATMASIDAFKRVLVKLASQYRDMRSGTRHFSLN